MIDRKLKYRGHLEEGRTTAPPAGARSELVEAMRAIATLLHYGPCWAASKRTICDASWPDPVKRETIMEWMIYGANGYTGALIAREAKRRGSAPILVGRDAAKITELAREGMPPVMRTR